MRTWAIVAGVSLGLSGSSLANPLDSPGTVYIDGVPCNLSCRSYMAWSRQTLNANQIAAKGAAENSGAKREAARKRISKRVEPALAAAPLRKKAGNSQAALSATPEASPLPKPRTGNVPLNVDSQAPPAAPTTAAEPLPVSQPRSESVALNAETSSRPKERTPQELVMAALAVAEQITNAEPSKANSDDHTDDTKTGDTKPSPARNVDSLVAVLITRPDVKSASALKGQNVAIDESQSSFQQEIRFALAATGATETQLSAADASPIDRVISGDVEAGVLKLVSPEAAEAFPDIKGFRVFRVPLTPQ